MRSKGKTMQNDFKYVEYNKDVIYRNSFKILELRALNGLQGFRSVYQINSEGKQWIEDNKGVAGFGQTGLPVWSDFLFVEFDDDLKSSKELFYKLKEDGIGFELYESGNRSYHFHILRDIEPHSNVPYTDKLFATELAPKCDQSLYKHLQPWRLEGTIHKKTGKPKKLLRFYKGIPYELELKEKPKREVIGGPDSFVFDDQYILADSVMGGAEGERNLLLSRLAARLISYGVPNDVIEWWVRTVNLRNDPPEEDERVEAILRSMLGGKNVKEKR